MALGALISVGSAAYKVGKKIQKARKKAKRGSIASYMPTSTSPFDPRVDTGPYRPQDVDPRVLEEIHEEEVLMGKATANTKLVIDPQTGKITRQRRHRRRRLLTAQDKADIAFLRGTLGGGELGRAAITAALTRRVG